MNSIRGSEGRKGEPIEHTDATHSTNGTSRLRASARNAARWLTAQLAVSEANGSAGSLARRAAICAFIILISLGVRLLHWEDRSIEIAGQHTLLTNLGKDYRLDAQRMIDEGAILIPSRHDDELNANLLPHPPGYSMLLRAMYGSDLNRESYSGLHFLQIFCDALAAVVVFLIAAKLVPTAVALIAAMLVAFSPHLSNFSLWLTPETLSVLPILIAVYLIVEATRRPRLTLFIAAGAMIGVSCWLRANGLMLAPFLALVILMVFERGKRWRYSLALAGAMIVVISPIAFRNWIVFHRFIPLSLGAGITLIQGIADYDTERRFDMPADDRETELKDAEWFGRPDYEQGLWSPDGIERDRYRFSRGLEVIRSNPMWFGGVMLRRASFMLKYDKPHASRWPFDTVLVPTVAAEPPFGHEYEIDTRQAEPRWKASPEELIGEGAKLSPRAEIQVTEDTRALQLTGDSSLFGDQLAFPPMDVEAHTDYLLTLPVNLVSGRMAAKVTSIDGRISLASLIISEWERKKIRKARKRASKPQDSQLAADTGLNDQMAEIKLAFSSGDRSRVVSIISNNGESSSKPILLIGQARLYKLGPTPRLWTRMVRPAVRGIQARIFTTSRMLPLLICGALILGLARRRNALLILLAVPGYYLSFQSVFHTEYRYILAIHYLLFIMAGITVYLICRLIGLGSARVLRRSDPHS